MNSACSMAFVRDLRETAAEVLIFDAQEIAAGPMTRVRIPQRLPAGFHACWVPGTGL